MNTGDQAIIVSPAYMVFEVNTDDLIPAFLLLWLSRDETGHYAWFMSETNVHSGMEKKRFLEVNVPISEKKEALVEISATLMGRRIYVAQIKEQINGRGHGFESRMLHHEAYWVLFLSVFERIGNMAKRYSQGFKDRAVRMVSDRLSQDGSCSQWRAVSEIAPRLGVAVESLRRWYEHSLAEAGQRPGLTREEHAEIKRLKRENAELRRANEILKTASAFFAAELDRPAR